jgi:hypothetical protein
VLLPVSAEAMLARVVLGVGDGCRARWEDAGRRDQQLDAGLFNRLPRSARRRVAVLLDRRGGGTMDSATARLGLLSRS